MKIIELKGWMHLQRTQILHPTDLTKSDIFMNENFLEETRKTNGNNQKQDTLTAN